MPPTPDKGAFSAAPVPAPPTKQPSPATLLRMLADEGDFERALARLGGMNSEEARRLLRQAADHLEARPQRELFAGDKAAGRATPEPTAKPEPRPPRPADAPRRVRIFSDGAARGNPGPAGAGAVIQDESGEILARVGRYLGRTTNNVAEYEGLLLGLRHALELGAREAEVVADSELLVRQLKGQYRVKAEHLQPLYQEARRLLSNFDKVRIVHVMREQNAAADQMSNRAIDEDMAD